MTGIRYSARGRVSIVAELQMPTNPDIVFDPMQDGVPN
jgi:hypothetical protein